MDDKSAQRTAGRTELLAAFFALTAIVSIQLVATRRLELFSHPLWLDETFTARLANDPSFTHTISAIRSGFDTNPPTLYLIYWPIARVLGGLNDGALRVISLTWMLLALTGLYAICRRFFSREASFLAIIAIWAHPLIVDQAFEARYYAPWFALTIWFAYLQMRARNDEPKSRAAVRYILAILATCIHYFGAITMSLIALFDFVVHRHVKRLLPAIVGLLALAACLPFIRGQRADLSVATWIDKLTAAELRDQLIAIFAAPSFLFVVILAWIVQMFVEPPRNEEPPRQLRELLPSSALLLLPIAIAVFSVVVQPAMMLRYSILAIAPLAPMLAAQIERLGRRATIVALLGVFVLGAASIVSKSHATRASDADIRGVLDAIDARVPSDAPIVFFHRREMYPALHARPWLASRIAQLDFDDATATRAKPLTRYERDMGRKAQRIYPDLRMVSVDELKQRDAFYIIAMTQDLDELARLLPPGFTISDREFILHRVTPASAAGSTTGR